MPHYAHLKQLIPPDSQKYTPSRVYVDSVKMISRNDKKRLLISGNLADGCTRLQKANHALQHDSLTISLTAWKPADKICTQALVPFSFIYDKLPPATLKTITTVRVNQNYFEIK